jgi:NAD(P)-dependent dehydrogenase (short-subunit alcohol dehydrogenase family)
MSSDVRFDFDGWNVVVTGATKNIGLATATAFARAGANLVVNARSADRLDEVAQELHGLGAGEVVPVAADVTVRDDVQRLADESLRALGGIDVLVNNVLVDISHSSALATDPDVWSQGLTAYVESPLQLTAAFAESMRERARGSIVNLVSTAAYTPIPGLVAYGTMKSAMWTMTRYLAQELAPEIRVNAVCPGTTSADGTSGGSAGWERLLAKVPLQRMATPDETARAILFLASDAASYTTGQVVFVDGGRVPLSGSPY